MAGALPERGRILPRSNGVSEANSPRSVICLLTTVCCADLNQDLILPGDTLYVCGQGFGTFQVPPGLSGTPSKPITISGACESFGGAPATWIGGASLGTFPSSNWLPVPGFVGTFQASLPISRSSTCRNNASMLPGFGVAVENDTSTRAPKMRRAQPANCSADGPAGLVWEGSDQADLLCLACRGTATTVFYRPGKHSGNKQMLYTDHGVEAAVSLHNSSHIVIRQFSIVGPAARLLDVTAGNSVMLTQNTLKWASYAAVTFNFKSLSGGGINFGCIRNNTIRECACGIYIVNQARPSDSSADSNHLQISDNKLLDIDPSNYYGNRDTHGK